MNTITLGSFSNAIEPEKSSAVPQLEDDALNLSFVSVHATDSHLRLTPKMRKMTLPAQRPLLLSPIGALCCQKLYLQTPSGWSSSITSLVIVAQEIKGGV